MSKQSISQITLKANEELIKRTKQKQRRNFYMVGKQSWTNLADKGEQPDWQYEGIDFIDAFTVMSNAERSVIKLLKDCITWSKELNSYNYVVSLSKNDIYFDTTYTDYIPYRTFMDSFRSLFQKDLVRRVARGKYMMNPDFFCITGEQVLYFERIWAESKRHVNAPTYKK